VKAWTFYGTGSWPQYPERIISWKNAIVIQINAIKLVDGCYVFVSKTYARYELAEHGVNVAYIPIAVQRFDHY